MNSLLVQTGVHSPEESLDEDEMRRRKLRFKSEATAYELILWFVTMKQLFELHISFYY